MKTVLVIISVLFAVGLVAGIVVPHDATSEAPVLAAQQPDAEPPPNRLVSNRNRGGAVTNSADGASDSAPLLTSTDRGAAVPLADILGVAGLLGGSVVTVLLLQRGRPDGGQRDARSEAPRHHP